MAKNTLNIYEVLETLNNKINDNTTLIKSNTKQLEEKTNQLKTQIDETKVYLLDELNIFKKSFYNKLELFKKETDKSLNYKQELLVSESFIKLKLDINKDLDNLANKVMNSRIL